MKYFYCKKCLMPSTRPRLKFNQDGICNSCEWAEKKKAGVDWSARWKELEELCDKYRSKDGSNWDVIVPCSYGKDSQHIAWSLKTKLNMNPLLVYVAPQIPSKIGIENKHVLLNQGLDGLQVDINPKTFWELTRRGFIEEGVPQAAFEGAILAAPVNIAIKLGIKLIMYGEEPDTEYGGDEGLREKAAVNREWTIEKYLRGRDPQKVYLKDGITKKDLKWWAIPSQEDVEKSNLFVTHWSYFENWDPILHRDTALKLGFKTIGNWNEAKNDIHVTDKATHTDYTSLDDPYMRTFHTYLMFLKFGFGRGTQEVSNDIRIGAMTREQGIEFAKKYDAYDCGDYRDILMKKLNMTREEWDSIIDKWANKSILEKVDGRWQLKKDIHYGLDVNNYLDI